ncbi:hypothetical protein CHUAL_008748 [Chamberlinius hualienensis]
MLTKNLALFFLFSLLVAVKCNDLFEDIDVSQYNLPEDTDVVRAVVESCDGCRLRKLQQVKDFITEDLPLFHNVEYKPIPQALPELILLNKNDEEVERIPLDQNDREDCNNLLLELGFYKKDSKDGPVPENYLKGPYKPNNKRDEL